MTPQEAIEKIRLAESEVEWEYSMDYAVAFDLAIEALEKRTPKRPYTNVIPYSYQPDVTVVQCPSCKRRLRTRRTMAKMDSFCPDCGQAIDKEGIDG